MNMITPTESADVCGDVCRRCGHAGSDLRLLGCGCTLHVRCTPLSLIVAEKSQTEPSFSTIPEPAPSNSLRCPICRSGVVAGVYLFPVSFLDLDTALDLRKHQAKAGSSSSKENNNNSLGSKRPRGDLDEDNNLMEQIQEESSYFLLSHTSSSHGHGDHHCHRTGRWTTEEITFVDQLVKAFDQGFLALPHGVKLNEFLGDMLVCKSSRLTKKMKNAKLSTRSYTIQNTAMSLAGNDQFCETLSVLQERFLQSVVSKATQLELRFNMNKLWRTHFSNLCLQVGYDGLDARDWLSSLEEMEKRASEAEDMIRKARRRRMGLALRKDAGHEANPGVFIGTMEAKGASALLAPGPKSSFDSSAAAALAPVLSSNDDIGPSEFNEDMESLSNFLEMSGVGNGSNNGRRPRLFSEDALTLDDLVDPLNLVSNMGDTSSARNACGPFLQQIVSFMRSAQLPFEHVDVWVPSYIPSNSDNVADDEKRELRLFHAGHATRSNVDSVLAIQLNEYGNYSTNFSFAPGAGLPGRVYVSGKPHWENSIHEADPHLFERAGGAKVYGVKAALGLPVDSQEVGRVVVAMYCTADVPEDPYVVKKCVDAISQWTPQPKWKLVIEMGGGTAETTPQLASVPGAVAVKESPLNGNSAPLPPTNVPTTTTTTALGTMVCHDHMTTTVSGSLVCHDHTKPGEATEQVKLKSDKSSWKPPNNGNNSSLYLSAQALQQQQQAIISPRPEKSVVSAAAATETEDELENRMASLLGDHMPLTASASPECPAELVRHFMSLRLLLLRSADRRSKEEAETLAIIKRSFRGYSKDNGRSGCELATLVAKDWMYLTAGSTPETSPSFTPQQAHDATTPQQHSSNTPQTSSPLLSKSLLLPPNALPGNLAHPVSFSSLGSFEQDHSKNPPRSRTVSSSTEMSPHQNAAALVVPEN